MTLVSFIIPTLNAASVLEPCLRSISIQTVTDYEIIIADGGSTDSTIQIAKKYHAKIFPNPLKTSEAGKAVGLKHAQGKYIALIDSDNILPTSKWLEKMLQPFSDPKIIGSEPYKFTYRQNAGFIERYSALAGANDPYAYITGVYDRFSYLSNKFTSLPIPIIDFPKYYQLTLAPNKIIPTIGANGTIFQASFLKKSQIGDYLFDIDLLSSYLQKTKKPLYFAKVKTSIIHTFCESSVSKFIRKQNRRLVDLYTYRHLRHYNWVSVNSLGAIKFILYTLLVFPLIFDTFRGFIKKPDLAWFFHPLACFICLYINSITTIKSKLGLLKKLDRTSWQQ